MNLILTMAGKYSRFLNEGYRLPKYLLPWGNRSILSEILYEMTKSGDFDNIYLIANKADVAFIPHVIDIMEKNGINRDNLFLTQDTTGQAQTAYFALLELQKKEPGTNSSVVFHNIDTILYNRNFSKISKSLSSCDGYIDVFKSNNHEYSYVLPDATGVEVREISEKVLISDLATSGLYAFSSAEIFLKYYTEKDSYISEIYKKMVLAKSKIRIGELHNEHDTIVLGTPREYLTASGLFFKNME